MQDLSFIEEFGFKDSHQFYNSLLRPKLLSSTVPIATIGGFIERLFGLEPIILIAFVALLTLELITGISASKIEGQKITSKRMKAFLLMFFVWLTILFILHQFSKLDNVVAATAFDYLFYSTIFFVGVIYLKSVFENVSRIIDKKEDMRRLINIFDKKLDKK